MKLLNPVGQRCDGRNIFCKGHRGTRLAPHWLGASRHSLPIGKDVVARISPARKTGIITEITAIFVAEHSVESRSNAQVKPRCATRAMLINTLDPTAEQCRVEPIVLGGTFTHRTRDLAVELVVPEDHRRQQVTRLTQALQTRHRNVRRESCCTRALLR